MIRILLALVLGLAPNAAWAWGQEGHSIIAEIAQRHLKGPARTIVNRLLQHGSLASISTWADDVKYTTRTETKPWHFVDISITQSVYDNKEKYDCKKDHTSTNPDECILWALPRIKTELRCAKGNDAKRDALSFAVHLIGDLTQPLHTVDEWHGANDVTATLNFCGKKDDKCQHPASVDYHKLWDTTLITETSYNWGGYVDRLYDKESGSSVSRLSKIAKENAAIIKAGTFEQLANDTHAVAKAIWGDPVRDPAGKGQITIDQKYYDMALEKVDRQLVIGGLYLARVLNEAYASKSCPKSSRK